ncbi:MAG TPA: T9SS type A sorting domain-containing protein [Saprospiraceae bacterium]|nr:T9SS type A sorting domain-containing protein [Saprospiraceae bacterium]HMQ81776.1 T9SS type A sorting domain-containing protein [Saprospiraceae bacterium]
MLKQMTRLFLLMPFFVQAQNVTTISNADVTDALVFDAQNRLFGADYTGSAVYQISLPDGASTIFADGFNTPNGMAFDSQGNLFLADNNGNSIFKIAPDGTVVDTIAFFNPSGLIRSINSDTLIATSYLGSKIAKIAPDGTVTDCWVAGELNGPVGLCYDDEGNLYTGNFTDRKIIRLLPNCTQELLVQGPTSGWLGFIAYLDGYIYGTLYSTHQIFRTDLEGNANVILGSTIGSVDGDALTAKFSAPNGIVASPYGDTLYISEYNTGKVRMITQLNGTSGSQDNISKLLLLELSPNPTQQTCHVSFEMNRPDVVNLVILDNAGRQVQVLLDHTALTVGKHMYTLQMDEWPAGIYNVALTIGEHLAQTKRLVKGH